MRVLVFGDSITQGFWDVDGGWVNSLRKYYDQKQMEDLDGNDEPVIFNLGISADTAKEVSGRVENETIARTRHGQKPIIAVQIGINDSMIERGSEKVSLEKYKNLLEQIITSGHKVASKVIFIGLSVCDEKLTRPVFWGNYHYINDRIAEYEKAMGEIAQKHQVAFIPVFDLFKAELDKGRVLLSDGLHPNDEGHKLIYELVQPELDKLLQ